MNTYQRLNFGMKIECCCCEQPISNQKIVLTAISLGAHNNNIRFPSQNSASVDKAAIPSRWLIQYTPPILHNTPPSQCTVIFRPPVRPYKKQWQLPPTTPRHPHSVMRGHPYLFGKWGKEERGAARRPWLCGWGGGADMTSRMVQGIRTRQYRINLAA